MHRMGSPKTGKLFRQIILIPIFSLFFNPLTNSEQKTRHRKKFSTARRTRRLQDRWVLIRKKLPEKPVELSITNTKSTKTVIEMRISTSPETNDFDLEESIEWVSCKSVSVHRMMDTVYEHTLWFVV